MLAVRPVSAELMAEEGIGRFNVVYVLGKKTALADPWWATIYTHAKDGSGVSRCGGACIEKWPPVTASADDTPFESFGIVERDDGLRQWMHQGRPLYTSTLDSARGDAFGHGIDGAWFVVEVEAHDM